MCTHPGTCYTFLLSPEERGGGLEPGACSVSPELLFPGLTQNPMRRVSVPSFAHQALSWAFSPEPSHLSILLLPAPGHLLGLESGRGHYPFLKPRGGSIPGSCQLHLDVLLTLCFSLQCGGPMVIFTPSSFNFTIPRTSWSPQGETRGGFAWNDCFAWSEPPSVLWPSVGSSHRALTGS